MDSISQKTENTKRYLPHDLKTKENAVKTYLNNGDIEYTCRKYHISRSSLWRWVKKYDGTKESLEDKSHKPKTRQTDNGTEFSYNQAKIKKEHPMDKLLDKLEIRHYKIRPRTPEHNGKVERSHRNDNERFYSYLKFYSLEDLQKQGKAYLKRSNNIPMAVLGYLTPKEKRAELELAVA